VVGWALDRNLEDDLAIGALKMALKRRNPTEGLELSRFLRQTVKSQDSSNGELTHGNISQEVQ
jgi:hypothetical protein